MTSDTTAIAVILGMAVVTYFTRVGGLWVMNRMTLTPRIEAWLNALPGTILVSIIAPSILTTGIAEALAGLTTALTAWRTKNLVLAMATGVLSVWLFRRIIV